MKKPEPPKPPRGRTINGPIIRPGDKRIRTRFLWFPTQIEGRWYWLRSVTTLQIYFGFWHDDHIIIKENEQQGS